MNFGHTIDSNKVSLFITNSLCASPTLWPSHYSAYVVSKNNHSAEDER